MYTHTPKSVVFHGWKDLYQPTVVGKGQAAMSSTKPSCRGSEMYSSAPTKAFSLRSGQSELPCKEPWGYKML